MTNNSRFSLQGKTIIVTGGAGFLGRNFCHGLAEFGANVVVADLDLAQCQKVAKELEEKCKVNSLGVCCNVCDSNSVNKMVEQVSLTMKTIDVLVNNAAYRGKSSKDLCALFEEYSLEEWKKMLDVNINGTFLCSQAVGKVMLKQKHGGSIIQISSIYGFLGTDHRIYENSNLDGARFNNPASYSTSKGAIIALTKYLATYWTDKIRVNILSPGGVKKDQPDSFINDYSKRVPMKRMAQPDELIGALVYLASDASNYVTGQNIIVDGGFSSW